MKQLRAFKALLLALAAAVSVAGCGVLPGGSNFNSSTTASCAVQSAEARPPKHPIVELAWCIARTDDLSDPNRLFHETLEIKNDRDYSESRNVPWRISAGAGNAEELQHLPAGVSNFYYTRADDDRPRIGGKRYFSFAVDIRKSCVTLADVIATFGDGFTVSPHRTVAPAVALPGVVPSPPFQTGKLQGIFYVTPRFFKGPSNGRVEFDFSYYECVGRITVQRDLESLKNQREEGKK
ncbi:hypothetical protein [Variovorax sp. OV700]|uniref:hypothetical protein n=1 Tax=Variovorax sp. OV700 TaxID=1882826 RepID=UPI00088A887E|nr:hypothetical protein [Variovorax sp. OV700]SDJ06821.1 hypothetical protein SAMN05444748_109205 [Variovorax sp. OV700]